MKRRPERAQATGQEGPELTVDGRRRVVIEAVMPEIDAGRFAAKRSVGETVTVESAHALHGATTLPIRWCATLHENASRCPWLRGLVHVPEWHPRYRTECGPREL